MKQKPDYPNFTFLIFAATDEINIRVILYNYTIFLFFKMPTYELL